MPRNPTAAQRAALAALLEAVQSKLTDIAGAREDIDPVDYSRTAPPAEPPGDGISLRSLASRLPVDGSSAATALDQMLSHLKAQGVQNLYVFPLGGEELGIDVVRVLGLGFDNAGEDGYVKLGARGLAALLKAAG